MYSICLLKVKDINMISNNLSELTAIQMLYGLKMLGFIYVITRSMLMIFWLVYFGVYYSSKNKYGNAQSKLFFISIEHVHINYTEQAAYKRKYSFTTPI